MFCSEKSRRINRKVGFRQKGIFWWEMHTELSNKVPIADWGSPVLNWYKTCAFSKLPPVWQALAWIIQVFLSIPLAEKLRKRLLFDWFPSLPQNIQFIDVCREQIITVNNKHPTLSPAKYNLVRYAFHSCENYRNVFRYWKLNILIRREDPQSIKKKLPKILNLLSCHSHQVTAIYNSL